MSYGIFLFLAHQLAYRANIMAVSKRAIRGIALFSKSVEANLRRFYNSTVASHSGIDFDQLLREVVVPNDDESIEVPFLILKRLMSQPAEDDEVIAKHPLGPILVGTAYLYRLKKSVQKGEMELAWSYVADAMFWTGYAASGKTFAEFNALKSNDLYQDELSDLQIESANKLASEKGKKYQAVQNVPKQKTKQFAQELALKRMPAGGWNSLGDAVDAIKEDVVDLHRKLTHLAA